MREEAEGEGDGEGDNSENRSAPDFADQGEAREEDLQIPDGARSTTVGSTRKVDTEHPYGKSPFDRSTNPYSMRLTVSELDESTWKAIDKVKFMKTELQLISNEEAFKILEKAYHETDPQRAGLNRGQLEELVNLVCKYKRGFTSLDLVNEMFKANTSEEAEQVYGFEQLTG